MAEYSADYLVARKGIKLADVMEYSKAGVKVARWAMCLV